LNTINSLKKEDQPNYVIFLEEKDLDVRVKKFKETFPSIEFEATIEPSLMDKVFHYLNPVNRKELCYIYKIGGK